MPSYGMKGRQKKFSFGHFVKKVLKATQEDTMNLHSAALSFFAIFTFVPLLLTSYIIYSRISENVATEFLITASDTLGSDSTNLLISIVRDLEQGTIPTFAYIIGSIVVFYAMTRFMYFLQKSMNKIWRTKPHMELLKIEIQHRVISVLSVIALIAVTTLITLQKITIAQITKFLGPVLSQLIFFIFTAFAMYSLFAFLYKFVPDRTIQWKDVRGGALFSTIAFWLGYIILRRVMQVSWVDNIYATISYAFLALLWIYVFAQIFYIGATICKVYAVQYGSLQKHREEFES
jgi:membrane protein